MALARNKKATKTDKEYTKTSYWVNFKTPVGQIGVNLTQGIDQHEPYIALLEKASVEKINAWFESKGIDCYITEIGKSNNEERINALVDEINNL